MKIKKGKDKVKGYTEILETEAFVIPVIFSGYFFLSEAKETLVTEKELYCTDFTS